MFSLKTTLSMSQEKKKIVIYGRKDLQKNEEMKIKGFSTVKIY